VHWQTKLALSQYMRLQNFANEEFGSTNLWAGFGKEFHKPIGLNETKEMLMARFEKVPVSKTYTCDLSEFGYLDEPQKKLRVPMHYVLKNDKANHLGTAPLPYGKVRIFIEGGKEQPTAFLGEDWGKFTPVDDEMRLYLGVAQDVVVKRTIEKNQGHRVAGNLYNQEVIVKFEIENRKDQPITLDIAENLRLLRNEVVNGDTGRDVHEGHLGTGRSEGVVQGRVAQEGPRVVGAGARDPGGDRSPRDVLRVDAAVVALERTIARGVTISCRESPDPSVCTTSPGAIPAAA